MLTKINAHLLFALCLTVLTWSCGPKPGSNETGKDKDPVATLEATVMASHDSSMAQMGTMVRLRKAVKNKLAATDSLLSLHKNDAALTTSRIKGTKVAADLSEADAEMMDWMHAYNADTLKKLNQANALDYLNDEKLKIGQVRDRMQQSISAAKAYVK